MKRKNPECRIEKETFKVACRTYGCYNTASYRIGNLKGTPMAFYHLCDSCMKGILENLPEELSIKHIDKEDKDEFKDFRETVYKLVNEKEYSLDEIKKIIEDRLEPSTVIAIDEVDDESILNDIYSMSYRDMQKMAKELNINATGTVDELRVRLINELRSDK